MGWLERSADEGRHRESEEVRVGGRAAALGTLIQCTGICADLSVPITSLVAFVLFNNGPSLLLTSMFIFAISSR